MSEDNTSIIDLGVDLNETEKPEALPIGTYRGVIINADKATSQSSGKDYIKLAVLVPPDEFPADYDSGAAADGVTLRYNMISLDVANNRRAAWRLRKFLEQFGVPLSSSLDLNELVGKEASVTIKHSPAMNDPELMVEEIEKLEAI